jgi:hypothetical protein
MLRRGTLKFVNPDNAGTKTFPKPHIEAPIQSAKGCRVGTNPAIEQ